jgi:hypothetical protein
MSRPERAHGSFGFGGFAARRGRRGEKGDHATDEYRWHRPPAHQLDFADRDAFPPVSTSSVFGLASSTMKLEAA